MTLADQSTQYSLVLVSSGIDGAFILLSVGLVVLCAVFAFIAVRFGLRQ